jgi:O-antigen/teichoic acid export membrane protein
MTGTIVAQAIPIAISPILTRLFSPSDFGLVALYVGISSIFGSIATGRYEAAIMLPADDEEAINIAGLGIGIALALSLFLLVVVILFNPLITGYLKNDNISVWLYFIPITVLLTGIYNVLIYYNNRIEAYRHIAINDVIKSSTQAMLQIGMALIKKGTYALILGQIFATFISTTILFIKTIQRIKGSLKVDFGKMQKVMIRYKNFPIYSVWGVFANVLSIHFINILISTLYSISVLGSYSLVHRVLAMPASLLGQSYGKIFYQRASEEKNKSGMADQIFYQSLKILSAIGVPTFLILYFVVEDLFAIVFGENWRVAGQYAKILIPYYGINFIINPMTFLLPAFEYQKLALKWHMGLLALSSSVIGISTLVFPDNFKVFLSLFSGVAILYYLFLFTILRRIAIKGYY